MIPIPPPLLGFAFGPCRITADALRGRSLEVNIQGSSQELLLYILERMAVEGSLTNLTKEFKAIPLKRTK